MLHCFCTARSAAQILIRTVTAATNWKTCWGRRLPLIAIPQSIRAKQGFGSVGFTLASYRPENSGNLKGKIIILHIAVRSIIVTSLTIAIIYCIILKIVII